MQTIIQSKDSQRVRMYFPEHNRNSKSKENQKCFTEFKQNSSVKVTIPACDDCGVVMFENVREFQIM